MQLERHSRITTDLRYGIEWYVIDEINAIGIPVDISYKEPQKIPPGEYYVVSNMVGEYDTLICDPTPRIPIIIKS